jgi:hypothetical protein
LDSFMIELQNDPSAQGYVMAFDGKTPGEAKRAIQRARAHLVTTRKLDPGRLTLVEAGKRDAAAVELWIVPGVRIRRAWKEQDNSESSSISWKPAGGLVQPPACEGHREARTERLRIPLHPHRRLAVVQPGIRR